MKPLSLTSRLFVSLFVVIMLALALVGLLGLRSADVKISQEYDAQLITATNVLWELMHEDVKQGDSFELDVAADSPLAKKIHYDALRKYSKWRAFRIWRGDEVMINSENTDDLPALPAEAGFSDVTIGNDSWRVFSLHIPKENIVVESFENLRNRVLLQRDILIGVAAPMLIILPLLALLISLCIRWGLERLRRLTGRLEARSPSDMSHVPDDDLPRELKPLARAVNTLLDKLESALAHEREFIDHAAHELRTPLSALKLQAQLIAKTLTDPAQKPAVAEFLHGVDRATRLVDQLLLLSRIAHQELALEPVELQACAREAIGLYATRALDKHITVALEDSGSATVMAQPELLRILLGTLLDNAVKYTPEGGDIVVAATANALSISDSGCGIPPAEQAQVFDRFYRVSSTRQQPGSGLGLAIARQIADLLQAEITLGTAEQGGLKAMVTFRA